RKVAALYTLPGVMKGVAGRPHVRAAAGDGVSPGGRVERDRARMTHFADIAVVLEASETQLTGRRLLRTGRLRRRREARHFVLERQLDPLAEERGGRVFPVLDQAGARRGMHVPGGPIPLVVLQSVEDPAQPRFLLSARRAELADDHGQRRRG